ncbi:protein SMAX1-LIKE 3 [Salvia hispanica]|uniref:protein SMAX1-LIKE 3 n=1 Tax=Salvia hispanica TaxID=49212 RepID=UPI0020091357|nr:protein SMAX1-LIKE 3 [Salvia hispanica]
MRASGSSAVQQALTAEAAGMVKQAVVLAKRRGHAQVTPLHVANTMLSASPGGLFRVACLDSHSHPLQCKALELCFNVALNRLPASSSPSPAISNALVAAFKRAQAHQRRGDNIQQQQQQQQQPLLAVKIELEQLIISILDDPSVSRVMREAGFSSTQVKINVEKAISLHLSTSSSPSPTPKQTLSSSPARNEDLDVIIDTLLFKKEKRSLALVGENTSSLEATVKALMERVERGEVAESLKEVKFISIPPLYTFSNLHRDQVELKIRELTRLVQSLVGRGVVLYLGDLKWISDYVEREGSYYCSVEHMIMEIGRLVWSVGEMERFWLMGIATFQTYIKCRNGYHSLQTVWGLHPLTIPVNSLAFTLVSHSDEKSEGGENGEMKLSCCVECSEKFHGQVRDMEAGANGPALSRLPSWLKDESRRLNDKDQKSDAMKELCKKWNSFCSSVHKTPSSSSPPSLGDAMDTDGAQRFKEFNAENLNLLCNALEEKVPWQKEIIPEIAGTVLQCRSGMLRRKSQSSDVKEETWLLFLGPDQNQAKEKIARELAKIVFGSHSNFASFGLSSFVDSDCRNKRGRDECRSFIDRFAAAAAADPHRVFLVEDLEEADQCSQMGIKRAIEKGRIVDQNGEEVGLCDAIVVLSCESFSSRSRGSSPGDDRKEEEAGGILDLNMSFQDQDHDDLGILENVDRRLVFKIQDLR